jgi:hypothetical protein
MASGTIQYGFKRISAENVKKLDHQTPHRSRLRGAKWVQACLKPQLESCVPKEVAFLYEVARGSMVYGMFFQPLASLAAEQCYRVLEAGARHRCAQLGLAEKKRPKPKVLPDTPFADLVKALKRASKIPDCDSDAWTTMPFLRNRFCHPTSQTIQSADSAVGVLAYTADLLNRLFE